MTFATLKIRIYKSSYYTIVVVDLNINKLDPLTLILFYFDGNRCSLVATIIRQTILITFDIYIIVYINVKTESRR